MSTVVKTLSHVLNLDQVTSVPSSSSSSSDSDFPWLQCCLTAILLFCLGLSGMYTATLLTSRGALVSLGNMFACGILLAAAFVHTIPDAITILSPLSEYPFSGLIVGATFIFLLLVEEIVHIYTHDDGEHHDDEDPTETLIPQSAHGSCGHGHSHGHGHGQAHGSREHSVPNSPLPNSSRHQCSDINHNTEQVHTHHNHLEQHLQGSFIAGVMLFLTLDIHSVFAGMSVGIQLNDMSLIFALAVHKVTAAFALGSTLSTIRIPRKQFLMFALFFSATTPLGVFIGAFFSNKTQKSKIFYGILHAIVGGTFLYIGILELGMKELLVCRTDPHGSGVKIGLEKIKLFALIVGYAVMASLAAWL